MPDESKTLQSRKRKQAPRNSNNIEKKTKTAENIEQ